MSINIFYYLALIITSIVISPDVHVDMRTLGGRQICSGIIYVPDKPDEFCPLNIEEELKNLCLEKYAQSPASLCNVTESEVGAMLIAEWNEKMQETSPIWVYEVVRRQNLAAEDISFLPPNMAISSNQTPMQAVCEFIKNGANNVLVNVVIKHSEDRTYVWHMITDEDSHIKAIVYTMLTPNLAIGRHARQGFFEAYPEYGSEFMNLYMNGYINLFGTGLKIGSADDTPVMHILTKVVSTMPPIYSVLNMIKTKVVSAKLGDKLIEINKDGIKDDFTLPYFWLREVLAKEKMQDHLFLFNDEECCPVPQIQYLYKLIDDYLLPGYNRMATLIRVEEGPSGIRLETAKRTLYLNQNRPKGILEIIAETLGCSRRNHESDVFVQEYLVMTFMLPEELAAKFTVQDDRLYISVSSAMYNFIERCKELYVGFERPRERIDNDLTVIR